MAKFWVDFQASIKIEAENKNEAEQKFFKQIPSEIEFVEVTDTEEVEEN